MTRKQLVQLSKLLSLMLRHQPERFGLTLDAEGYASLDEVLQAAHIQLPLVTLEDLHSVVAQIEPDKRRFSIVDGEIRANYGHSLTAQIEHPAVTPPALLLHGTTHAAVTSILANGLLPMRRQYVHLTTERALAERIGARHGAACVLTVIAEQAAADGVIFYRANPSFWLAKAVPARYISGA
jgi:putative RNA 2'-phosphotransferase